MSGDEFDQLLRELVEEIVNEFTGAGACPGYTLPLGMSIDPESPTLKLKRKWPKPKAKKKHKT